MTTTAFADTKVVWLAPAEYAAYRRLGIATVYRRLKAGRVPGAEQAAGGHAWRIPVPTASGS